MPFSDKQTNAVCESIFSEWFDVRPFLQPLEFAVLVGRLLCCDAAPSTCLSQSRRLGSFCHLVCQVHEICSWVVC